MVEQHDVEEARDHGVIADGAKASEAGTESGDFDQSGTHWRRLRASPPAREVWVAAVAWKSDY
jgi:hypothetical protein